MKGIIPFFTLFIYSSSFGQTNYQIFKKFAEKNDTVKMRTLISKWEQQKDLDAEFYVCAFNYYFSKSQKEIIELNAGQKKESTKETINLLDSKGKQAGYMSFSSSYDKVFLTKALFYADQGIAKFPDRLDIRLGKCHVLQEIEDYSSFVSELKTTINYSLQNHNNWFGEENNKIESGENYFTNTIYSYQAELYNTENDDLLKYIQEIGDYCIKFYPKTVEILSMTAVSYLLENKYENAIDYFIKAERINPKDCIVLNNLAQTYIRKGDKANGIKYYELTQKFGSSAEIEDAKKQILKLRK